MGNGALFLAFTALTSAKHCSLISIWHPPLVTHGYTLDPHSPIFLELEGPSCLQNTAPISRPRQAASKLEMEHLHDGGSKKKKKKRVCTSSNSTLKNCCWYSSRHFSVICYNAFCLHFTLEVPRLWEKRKATFFVQMSNSLLYSTQGRRLNYLPVQTQPVNNFS